MAKSLDLTMMSLLVICLAISVGTSYAHDSPPAGPSGGGDSNNEQFEIKVEKDLQVCFGLIDQGKKSEAEMKLQVLGREVMKGYPSMTVEEKFAKLSEIALKIKKSFKIETQANVDEWLGGVQMGLKGGGSNNEQFEIKVEKDLQVCFGLIDQGKKSEAEMKLQVLGREVMKGYPSMTVEEKFAKLSEIALKIKKSFKIETQANVDEWLGGVQMGLKLSLGGINFQKTIFEKLLEQKLRIAFQVIELGNPAKGQKMLEVIGDIVEANKSMSRQEKLSLMAQITLKIKPSLNKETQSAAEEYAAGVQFGAQFLTNP